MNVVVCDVCGERRATRGNIRRVDGVDRTTHYCAECPYTVPIGHTVWAGVESRPVSRWLLLAVTAVLGAAAALGCGGTDTERPEPAYNQSSLCDRRDG